MGWLVLSYDRWKPQRKCDGSMSESFLLVGQGWILRAGAPLARG